MDRHTLALQLLHEGTVIPAIPLALDAERQFDRAAQERLVRYYMQAGSGGVAAAVHSTQFAIRDPKYSLFEPVLECVVRQMEAYEAQTGKTLVRISGVCGPTEQACREAELARSYGYDAVLLSPGGLNHWTEAALLARTAAVAKVLPVIGFYLPDAVGGRKLSQDYWRRLADTPGVAAVKCACFDRYRTEDLVKGVLQSGRWQDVTLYTGNDDHILFDLLTPFTCTVDGEVRQKYFDGGLLGQWSVWTHAAAELFRACRACRQSGSVPSALLAAAERLTQCNGAIFDVAHGFAGCIPGLHYVLQRQGLMEGTWCLDENETLSEGQASLIDALWAQYPELADDAFVRSFLASERV